MNLPASIAPVLFTLAFVAPSYAQKPAEPPAAELVAPTPDDTTIATTQRSCGTFTRPFSRQICDALGDDCPPQMRALLGDI